MTYTLHAAHLYGDLMNTYGDIGNILAMRYYAKAVDADITVDLVSLDDRFDEEKYDFALFGGVRITSKRLFPRIYKRKKTPWPHISKPVAHY